MASLFLFAAPVGPQSGPNKTVNPGLEFRLVRTKKLATFEKELTALAALGFRLEQVLETSAVLEQAAVLSRPGLVTDGPRYEYKLLTTRRSATLGKELEAAAQEGYELRGLAATARPYVGSEITAVLERPVGQTTPRFVYQLLALSIGKEEKYQESLPKALAEGFQPLKFIQALDMGIGLFVGAGNSANLLVAAKPAGQTAALPAETPEFKVLETYRLSTMLKELNQAAKDGFQLYLGTPSSVVIMARRKGERAARYEYRLLDVGKPEKTAADLQKLAQEGFVYCSALGGLKGLDLVFERDTVSPPGDPRPEYKVVQAPLKEKERGKFERELGEAAQAGFRLLAFAFWGELAAILVR